MDIKKLLQDFMSNTFHPENIYNEFSLQHELGLYLREKLKDTYTVKFERNIVDLIDDAKQLKAQDKQLSNSTICQILKPKLKKKEIDIVIQNKDFPEEKYAIELKYPRNGQYPEEMYSFIVDIDFTEKLTKHGFTNAYCLTVVDDDKFYNNQLKLDGIYQYFRNQAEIKGVINKPTGKEDKKKNEFCKIENSYVITWHCIEKDGHQYHYYIIPE